MQSCPSLHYRMGEGATALPLAEEHTKALQNKQLGVYLAL
jgi:hypothetical protein